MKILSGIVLLWCVIISGPPAIGQAKCASTDYTEQLKKLYPAISSRLAAAERFVIEQQSGNTLDINSNDITPANIHIPVVIHILYHSDNENISDAQIKTQLDALNRDYRRLNADTINTPARFRSVAADMQIEFALATSDITGRATTGVIRKHTNTVRWQMTDEMKFSGNGGDDGWDSRYYLNIWVCNLQGYLGYSSLPGGPEDKDGVVISTTAFGTVNTAAPYNLGRTAVHEIGHWLGLKHIWGDSFCGDDLVGDTPKQGSFTVGCPGNKFITTCDNGPLGDMYMNYMDFTDDACMNLFTAGQKQRVLSFFQPGGARNLLLSSKGLMQPWVFTSLPVVTETPKDQPTIKLYPNPAVNDLIMVLSADWIGKDLKMVNLNGSLIATIRVTAATQKISVEKLMPGMYILEVKNNNENIRQRFLKL